MNYNKVIKILQKATSVWKTTTSIVLILSMILTSCSSEHYKVITHIDRNGSGWRTMTTAMTDSITGLFPYDISHGWEVLLTDTAKEEHLSSQSKKDITIRKNFKFLNHLSDDLRTDIIFPVAKESLIKRFRWFYTYYDFTSIYPELTDKGRTPLDEYLNQSEQRFLLQGDQSAYRGMNGIELKEALDDIESRFLKWYNRSVFEENFDVILHHTAADFRSKLPVVKDTLYSIFEKQNHEEASVKDVCLALDNFFSTNLFSKLHSEKEREMNSMLEERMKVIESLQRYSIQYELTLPGKIITANTDLQDGRMLQWNIDLYRFLADDYMLTAQSRTLNLWAFVVTLLLIVFSIYCFMIKQRRLR